MHFGIARVLWCDDANGVPNNDNLCCAPRSHNHTDSFKAISLENVVLKTNSDGPVKVGNHNYIPPKEWCIHAVCTCHDKLWDNHVITVVYGLVNFNKGPATN